MNLDYLTHHLFLLGLMDLERGWDWWRAERVTGCPDHPGNLQMIIASPVVTSLVGLSVIGCYVF